MNILFVCSGNTCRSPLAMAILNSAEIKGVFADSAGLSVPYYNNCSLSNRVLVNEKSVNALEYLNISPKYIINYVPKPLTARLFYKADIIAVMENSHKLFIESFLKTEEEKNKKIIVLNVPDPFGQSQEVYNKTAIVLKEKINELISIKKINAHKNNNFTCAGITETQAKELEYIEIQCFKKPWSKQSFKESLNTDFYIYYLNGLAVGYIGILKVLNERYITNIGVLKEYRNKKVATSLMCAAIKTAKLENAAFISLEVRKSNTNAINLYKKFNFKLAGERKNFYTSPLEDAYIFTLNF